MKRQRGFGLLELALLAGGAVFVMGVVYWIDVSRQNIGAAKQIAKYAPVIEQCKAMGNEDPAKCAVAIRAAITGRDTCLAANKSLDDQFAAFRKQHNEEIEAAHAEYKNAQARKAQAVTANAPRLADLAMEKFNLITSATKGEGMTCAEFDAAALEEAKRKFKFYGPAAMPEAPKGGLRVVDEPAPAMPTRPPAVNPLRPK